MGLDETPRFLTFYLRHHRRFELVFIAFWLAMLTHSAIALLRGVPQTYTGEYTGTLVIASASIVGSIGVLSKRPYLHLLLAIVSLCILGIGIWRIYR